MISLALAMLLSSAFAQEPLPEDRGSAGLLQTLRKLERNVRVMHIAAHPDDEDAATLTWLARGQGAHLVLLALNRGEAGANMVSNDFFDRLGALRTVEFLRAVQYYGADGLRFTRFVDYGYSKNVEETFRNWNRDDVLRDVVRVIRQERPHILISRFQGNTRDGHGNHTAAGIMARLAFEAAADPARFQDAGPAWRVLKLYCGGWRENEDWTIRVNSGQYDPMLGRTYAQMGREGYRMHRSQGMAVPIPAPAPLYAYYKLLASRVGMAAKESSFFDRLNLPEAAWAGEVRKARAAFRAEDPSAVAPALAAALDIARRARDAVAERHLLTALEQALGLFFEATASSEFTNATPGQKFTVATKFLSPGADPAITPTRVELVTAWPTNGFEVTVPAAAPHTRAYWSRPSVHQTHYDLDDDKLFGSPLPPAPLRARSWYRIDGVEAYVERDVLAARKSLAVAPPVSLQYATDAGYLPIGAPSYRLTVAMRSHLPDAARGKLRIELPPGWTSTPPTRDFAIDKEGEQATQTFDIAPPARVTEGESPVRAIAQINGIETSDTFLSITQPGLATVNLSRPAKHTIRVVGVKISNNLRTAYIPGTGDDVSEAMRQLGAAPDILDTSALATGDLSKYNTIVMGIRAYAARQDVKTYNGRLLDYVRNGGVLIVQYNTQEYDNNYGPFPYTMTARAEEVSEENSPVEIVDPNDPVFTTPNKITARDFEGWVEQRGSKFFTTWDPQWKPLIETHDTGQPPQKGAWLVARHGKGLYVYCAMAWYRQLPFAVPGAARIFANLISLGAR